MGWCLDNLPRGQLPGGAGTACSNHASSLYTFHGGAVVGVRWACSVPRTGGGWQLHAALL